MPIRWSRPMPRATSSTSAPVSSQTLAISLMNEILVARNALAASLIISALAMSVRTSGAPSGSYSSTTASPAQSPSSPTTTRSGWRKSSSAEPSLRNSGQETYANPALPCSAKIRLIAAPVPTGTVDFITSACVAGRRHRSDDRVHGRQVGVAGVGRRRADGDEQQPRVLERRRELGREVQPLAVAGDALARARARRSGSRRGAGARSSRRRRRRTRPRCRARRSRPP